MGVVKESSTNQFNRKNVLEKCPVTFTLEKIGGRWKPLILWQLKDGRKRYSEIRKSIPLVSEKMLIQNLKELEADELIVREARQVVPPFVEYRMTSKGEEIRSILSAMAAWGIRNQ